MFKAINDKQSTVYEKVIDELKNVIFQGKLKPGDRLPPERALAEMLGVSRTSLREALKLMEAAGLIFIKRGQGIFVADHDPDQYMDNFLSHLLVSDDKLSELFEIRKVLETEAASWAALRGSESQIKELEKLVEDTLTSLEKYMSNKSTLLAEHDIEFHRKLIEASNNSVLIRVMDSLYDLLMGSKSKAMTVPKRAEKSLQEHKMIVEALSQRDAQSAKKAMLNHIQNAEKDVFGK